MSKVSKVVRSGYNHTKNLSKAATKEVFGVAYLPRDVQTGYKCAKRLSDTRGLTKIQTVKTMGIGVMRKGITPHLPGILAGIGTVLPFFGTSALGLVVVKFLQKAIKKS